MACFYRGFWCDLCPLHAPWRTVESHGWLSVVLDLLHRALERDGASGALAHVAREEKEGGVQVELDFVPREGDVWVRDLRCVCRHVFWRCAVEGPAARVQARVWNGVMLCGAVRIATTWYSLQRAAIMRYNMRYSTRAAHTDAVVHLLHVLLYYKTQDVLGTASNMANVQLKM